MKKYFFALIIILISIFSFNNKINAETLSNYHLTQFYNSNTLEFESVDFYLDNADFEYMFHTDFDTFYSTKNSYSSASMSTIKSYLEDGMLDYYISTYGPYYIIYNGGTYNGNYIFFFDNPENFFFQRINFSSYFGIKPIITNSYSINFNKTSNGNITFKESFDFGFLCFTDSENDDYYDADDGFDEKGTHHIYVSDPILLDALLGNYSLINMTKTFANDLEGNEIYIIRSDFSKVFDADYTYQIKTDYTDWQDITSDIFEASNSGYYFYDYTLKYNSKVYVRVLNMQSEVVEDNEIEVTELKDYMNITYAPANDLNGNYVIAFTVDLRNCWNNSYSYQYSYDNETFYNMSVDENNQVFYLNHGIPTPVHFRVIDSSNNVICQRDYIEPFEGLSFSPITEEFIEIVNGFRMIGYSIDISKFMAFSDIYNYRFVINGIEQDAREVFTWNIYEENFDTFEEIDFKLYVDNYLISNIKYSPRYTQDNFDDKYTEIADNILNKDDSIYGFIDMFKNAFEDFYSSIISIGSDINDLWIGMSEVLRNFFIVIFVLILFGFIIRFIL